MEEKNIMFDGERYKIKIDTKNEEKKSIDDVGEIVEGCKIDLDNDSVFISIKDKTYQFSRNNVRDILREIIYSQ